MPTFERFTDEARHVVVEAQAEARELRHGFIGTEHLLLGICRGPDTDAATVLREVGIDAERARARVVARVPAGSEEPYGQVPFTPRAKKSLELALRECISHGNERVMPEHLLLGLLREGEGVASRVVRELGADPEALRAEVAQRLPAPGEPAPVSRLQFKSRGTVSTSHADAAFLHVGFTPEARRLLMQAGAHALTDGRSEIDVADLHAALRREPPEAAAG